VRYAALRHWRQASVRAAALSGHDRHSRAVTANGWRNAEPWVKAVQDGVGAGQYGARPVMQQRAGRQVRAGPRAEGDVEACLLEQGEVRDRQRRVAVFDEDPWAVPGPAA
jgi:hypothetical protein